MENLANNKLNAKAKSFISEKWAIKTFKGEKAGWFDSYDMRIGNTKVDIKSTPLKKGRWRFRFRLWNIQKRCNYFLCICYDEKYEYPCLLLLIPSHAITTNCGITFSIYKMKKDCWHQYFKTIPETKRILGTNKIYQQKYHKKWKLQ